MPRATYRFLLISTSASDSSAPVMVSSGVFCEGQRIHRLRRGEKRLDFVDLLIGAAIGVYVVKEALEILSHARAAKSTA